MLSGALVLAVVTILTYNMSKKDGEPVMVRKPLRKVHHRTGGVFNAYQQLDSPDAGGKIEDPRLR